MNRFFIRLIYTLSALLLLTITAHSDDWTTLGSDAQRSSWVRTDARISPATVHAPEFQFLWKIQLDNKARGGNALTPPVLLDFLISHRGFRSLAFVGGSSGGVFAMDTDLARMEWERYFAAGSSHSSPDCPGGMTANLTRPTPAAMPSLLGFGARGRRTPAKSGVGKPGEGAVTLAMMNRSRRTPSVAPPPGRTRPAAQRALRGVFLVHALTADGMLHSLYVSNGLDHTPPVKFLPGNANARGLIVVDNVAYVATSNTCGDAGDGVWALDLGTNRVARWESDTGSIQGSAGVAIGPDGTVYATTREGSLVALESKTLRLSGKSPSIRFLSSPLVFDYEGSDHLIALGQDGILHLFKADNLDVALARSPVISQDGSSETALAAWRDTDGTHWIIAPSKDSVSGWKIVVDSGHYRLEKGWESGKMNSPLPPIVINGAVFALSGSSSSGSAKLHALDGITGKPLWDSGDTIGSSAHGLALAAGPSHIYLTTQENAVYSFGFPMEH